MAAATPSGVARRRLDDRDWLGRFDLESLRSGVDRRRSLPDRASAGDSPQLRKTVGQISRSLPTEPTSCTPSPRPQVLDSPFTRSTRRTARRFEKGMSPSMPFFSPDGQWIGFVSGTLFDASLRKVPIFGGPSVPVSDVSGYLGASWGDDDQIILGSTFGLRRVPAAGGQPETLTAPEGPPNVTCHCWPTILPDGESVVFVEKLTASLAQRATSHPGPGQRRRDPTRSRRHRSALRRDGPPPLRRRRPVTARGPLRSRDRDDSGLFRHGRRTNPGQAERGRQLQRLRRGADWSTPPRRQERAMRSAPSTGSIAKAGRRRSPRRRAPTSTRECRQKEPAFS